MISTVVYRQCVKKFARISKKEAVPFCWISSECEESFLRSGSLMGSCREKGKGKGMEIRGRRKDREEEDERRGRDSKSFKTYSQLSQGAYPCECPEFIGVFPLERSPGECA